MKHLCVSTLLWSLPFTTLPHVAQAMDTDVVQARILSGARMADGRHIAGLELSLAAGWKTYWRAPGESGIAPIFDLNGSDNLASYVIEWPQPTLDVTYDMVSVVYQDSVVLPLILTPKDPAQDITVTLSADIGVCDTVCIPKTIGAHATLDAQDHQMESALSAARQALIPDSRTVGQISAACRLRPAGQDLGLELTYAGVVHDALTYATVEIADPALYSFEIIHHAGLNNQISGKIASLTGDPIALARGDITVTVIERDRSFAFNGCWPDYP